MNYKREYFFHSLPDPPMKRRISNEEKIFLYFFIYLLEYSVNNFYGGILFEYNSQFYIRRETI